MATAAPSDLLPQPDALPPTGPSSNAQVPDKDDVDTCRICRGEGTPEEPLFFPCKCSGSIKYVHQECLMEWLSHSQKKYCELCKTSFRFTKLYHPSMPITIPTSVFLRRAAVHILKLFMTWCRAVLVGSVWLVFLPWCMRVVWRSLFWVGDGGWNRDDYIDLRGSGNETFISSVYDLNAVHAAVKAAKAANRSIDLPTPNLLTPFSQTVNMSAGEPTIWNIAKRFFFGFAHPLHTLANATADYLGPRNPSLLSDVSFFNWFPSQAANRFLIDVLEGQIITLAVVVAFILIFLIREWVVQQQPVINMVAEDAAAAAANQMPEHQENDVEDEGAAEHIHDPVQELDAAGTAEREDDDGTPATLPPSPYAERLANDAFRTWRESGEVSDALLDEATLVLIRTTKQEDVGDETKWIFEQLPDDLIEEALRKARERSEPTVPRGRSHPERSSSPANNPDGDQEQPTTVAERSAAAVPDSWEDEVAENASGNKLWDTSTNDQEQGSDHSSESWQQVPDIVVEKSDQESANDKGKAKALDDDYSDSIATSSTPPKLAGGLLEADAAHYADASEAGDANSNLSTCGSDSYRDGLESDTDDPPLDAAPPLQQAQEQGTEEREAEPEPPGDVRPPRHLLDRIFDWIFDGVAPGVQAAEDGANDEHVVRDLADEPPFVPFAANEPREPANLPIQDPEVAAAAAQAGIDVNDQDAIDDAEDLEGIMELIGMQGPLTGLFQNAMFSAVLISATLACAVWLPYLWGKVVILFMGSPVALFIKLPLQIVATLADLLVDGALLLAAGVVYGTLNGAKWAIHYVSLGILGKKVVYPLDLFIEPAQTVAASAADRLGKLMMESPLLPPPTYFRLSINSHVAMRTIQNATSHTLNQTSAAVTTLLEDASGISTSEVAFSAFRLLPHAVKVALTTLYDKTASLTSWLLTTKSYKVTFDLDLGGNFNTASAAAEQWTATDRLVAVFAGYAFFALAGAVYLKRGVPFSSSRQGQKIERIISEILQQAGGVLKVILIISIEMLVFPLYCGLLLDMALLPLFKDANLYTRWQFTRDSPWTSGFVHWFIGTCYMFHFALFVSMCRKIMRRGVLYFIRDPDDPQFHPVRDVLERSVTTQLRKIAFSALVYGALVIICLGGVVWSLSRLTTGVLPIHWVSHAPSLEFPLDLLFYNFLTPVIIKLYKPSDGLHAISQWWFKRCARFLRLSNFLFAEKAKNQEGRTVNGRVIFEGKYVRAPASDQVRIPKGDPVFVEVDSKNNRKDGQRAEGGVHNSNLVTVVYIPPWFRLRIGIFVLTIWLFAAVTGVSATIIPLVFGRYIFSLVLPSNVEMNDIHSFSLGVYSLGSLCYTTFQAYKFFRGVNRPATSALTTIYNIAATASHLSFRVLRFTYVWSSLILVIPFLFAVLIELYALMPLHAYIGPTEPHVVHLIQDWTLGFLYARLAARIIFSDRASRPARAFAAVTQHGYLNPNAKIATRCFLLPALSLFAVAIVVPSAFAISVNLTVCKGAKEVLKNLVWRFSYPAVGCAVGFVWIAKEGLSVLRRWRSVVRDEVYLIGERLHNFGERRARVQPARRRNTFPGFEAPERDAILVDGR
ncbi:hypothetical protein N0V90_007059 [Kalmusia sp. IMI 367209]|nr:hypothetical protein N0V90_007059 [Kalmusia sp. IMI 367209]